MHFYWQFDNFFSRYDQSVFFRTFTSFNLSPKSAFFLRSFRHQSYSSSTSFDCNTDFISNRIDYFWSEMTVRQIVRNERHRRGGELEYTKDRWWWQKIGKGEGRGEGERRGLWKILSRPLISYWDLEAEVERGGEFEIAPSTLLLRNWKMNGTFH